MIQIISSGSKDDSGVNSFASSSLRIIPLSVLGSIISNAPNESRNEKSGARMTCPIDRATIRGLIQGIGRTFCGREEFGGDILCALRDLLIIGDIQAIDICAVNE